MKLYFDDSTKNHKNLELTMVNADDYWERFYNPRIAVPDFQNYIDRWYDSTLKFKKNLGKSIEIEMDVPYGDSIVETMDIFKPKKSVGSIKALMLFIHGGYWRSKDLTKKEHGFIAKPFVEKGFAVAVLDYALCPDVSMPDICKQIVKAGECLYRDAREVGVSKKNLYVVGHSAGAHLAAMSLVCIWKQLNKKLPKRIFKSALGLSGIYDLRPLINVQSVNADLKLDKNLASLVSPALIAPPKTAGLTISVGGQETEGFKEQHSIIAEKWQGSILNDIPSPEDNHFSILDTFVDPSSDLHNYWVNVLNGNH